MSYCPECGEQIAKEDVFCPFCGISLKPIASVEDSSLSETIVGMPPPAFNKENSDASKAKSGAETPQIENQPPPLAAPTEKSEPLVAKPENSSGFPAGDTSENWAMKTESVEIPAENLEDIRSIPLPSPFGDDEPVPTAAEDAAPFVVTPPPSPFSTVEPKMAATSEKSDVYGNLGDIPTPAIIQEQNIVETEDPAPEAKPLAEPPAANELNEGIKSGKDEAGIEEPEFKSPESFEPFVPKPVTEPADFFEAVTESSSFEKTLEPSPIEDKIESFDSVPTEIPADLAETNLNAGITPPVSNEPAPADEPAKPTEEISPEVSAPEKEAAPFEETPKEEIIEPLAQSPEPPIMMPDLPLALENQEELSRFDSVQIIQKKEIEEEKVRSAELELKAAGAKTPVAESQTEAKAPHSQTTPNIGNSDTDGRKAAKLKPLEEGTILNNRYEIVRKIGGGGMGAVYLANDRNLGGVLRAVKEMVQSYIESEQQDKAVSDFKRESLLLTSLDHTAIPTIYDYFFDEKEGRFYLVMKYISGGDLASRLRAAPEGRLDEKTVTEWAIQIADVLHYLHTHEPSIVYRDLKPANVMIDGNSGRVMLIDFGIARWVNKEEKGVTAVGTMGYAPPELFSGNVEPRSDIYSLGSTMFHLLTGADPQSNPLLIFDFQKNPRPRQINSQLSDQIEQILMRSVEYNADARFSSAAELRDALKEHLINLQTGKVTFGVKVAPSNRAFSEQAVFCGFCGKQIVATDVFCAFCGAQQPIAHQGVSQPSIAVHPMTAKLVIQGTGELEPSSFRLEKNDNLLGRRDPMSNIFPEVDLSKYDPQTKISRRHARIWREGNSFLVEDLGSSNGTTLLPSSNDSVRLLPHQPHTLTNGDKIRLGDTTLHFTIG
jgi:serine/threonine-protein kinase